MAKFSIVIPLYNKQHYIRKCIDSVLSQTETDYELVVVNDGSTDGSLATVCSYKDKRIKIITQQNTGAGPSRNRGVIESSGSWVAFLDADDLWTCDHLAELKSLIDEYEDVGIVSTRSIEADVSKVPLLSNSVHEWNHRKIDYFREAELNKGLINSSSVAIKRSVFDNVGYFRNFQQGEDTEFWVRVCLVYPCAVSEKPTSYYCRGTNGIMEKNAVIHKQNETRINSIRDLGPVVSYLVDELLAGNVDGKLKNSVALFINSRITTALRISLLTNKVDQMSTLGAYYMAPLLFRHRIWRVISKMPIRLLTYVAEVRSVMRSVYHFAVNKLDRS